MKAHLTLKKWAKTIIKLFTPPDNRITIENTFSPVQLSSLLPHGMVREREHMGTSLIKAHQNKPAKITLQHYTYKILNKRALKGRYTLQIVHKTSKHASIVLPPRSITIDLRRTTGLALL